MKANLSRFLGALAISWGLSTAAWGQQPLPAPAPLPAPTPAVDGTRNNDSGTTAPMPVVPGGTIDALLPRGGLGGTWVVGGGIYVLGPISSNARAFTNEPIIGRASETNFTVNLNVAPLAFVGYSWDNGWGVRFRWYQFSADASASATFAGQVEDATGRQAQLLGSGTVSASGHLHVSAYDLEATYNTTMGQWLLVGSAGARYGQINQGYGFEAAAVATGRSFASSDNHDFNGFGPTFALEGHRRLGDSTFGLYASARASILFGSGQYSDSSMLTISPGNGRATGLGTSSSSSQTSVIPVGELEFGGEWSRAWGRLRLFAQVGVVGQIWWGTGSASDSASSQSGAPSNLGFIGGVARAGVSF